MAVFGVILILAAIALPVVRRGRKGIGKWIGAGLFALLGLVFVMIGSAAGSGGPGSTAATTAGQASAPAKGTTPTASVRASNTPAAKAAPASATWQTVATWKGDAGGNTQIFTVANPWRIVWTSAPGTSGPGNFAATVNNKGSLLPRDMVGDVIGKGGATSYESSSGTFYLDIQADEPYVVTVETKVSALPKQPHYTWSTVTSVSGNSTLNTKPFTVAVPWRVVWASKPGNAGSGNFAVDVQSPGNSGLPVDSFADVIGTDHGIAYEYQAGTFQLSVSADEDYSIQVQQGK